MSRCNSCGDSYDNPWNDDGDCEACALEKEGDLSMAVADVFARNDAEAARRESHHNSLPEGQRSGKRHTGG